jgi:hypothetical protein
VVTALILISGLVVGQAPENPAASSDALTTRVKTLVKQLDSNAVADREAAEKALVEIGPDVLTLLPTTTDRTPAEVKNRLGRVRNALVKAEVEAATKPALVTLSGEMPASEALAAVAKQTGNKLVDYRERFNQEGADPKIKVALDKAPFWEALDTILDAASLTIYNYDEEQGALAYTSRGAEAGPRVGRGSYSGLFRLEPTQIQATRDLRNPDMHALKLTVAAVWEPRVRTIVLEVPLGDTAATDESGKAIGIDSSEGTLEVPVETSNTAVEIEFPLTAPDRNVKTLAALKGKLTAVLLGKVETFEFADIEKARAVEQERGGVTVIVESCRKNGDVYDVSMRVRFDRAANALESHRGWIYDNESYLLDAKGNRIDSAGLEATLVDVNAVGLSYKFDLDNASPVGCKFIYKTPAAIIRIPVAFELKDVALP